MKAAVMTSFKEPLEIQDLPDPSAGPRDAIIQVEACGICRSDWHMWQHDWTWLGVELELPRVLGHEFGGVVEEVGKDVENFRAGDRVTVPFHLACGKCKHCQSGHSNICMAYGVIGAHHNGGYGSMVQVPNADATLVHLPDEVDSLAAAGLGCRYMTAYHGIVDQARVQPGEWVAVFGMGGVGLSCVQIATAVGARVLAVSRGEDKLKQAEQEGAIATVKAGEDTAQQIQEITQGGADVSVDAVGTSETAIPAILSLGKGGRHVQLGLTGAADGGTISLPVDLMVFQEIRFLGSFGCPTTGYPGMLDLVARGKLKPNRLVEQKVSVESASDVLQAMTDYKTRGFTVINSW
jgi:propanol-preferring alcohol dehydrogenase